MRYLAKYSPEIGTKSNRTKQKFIRQLKKNMADGLSHALSDEEFQESRINPTINHVIIDVPRDMSTVLEKVAGIKYFVQVEHFKLESLEALAEKGEVFFNDKVEASGTFAVRCKKTGNQAFESKKVEILLGDRLSQYGKVNLNHPAVTCSVEIRNKDVYFYDTQNAGMEGAPLGVQGKAMTLFSGGIDSPVAAWFAYKAGLDQDFLYFDLGSEDQKVKAKEVFKVLKQQWGSGSSARFIEIDFLDSIQEILKVDEAYQNLVLKYCFYQVADKVAKIHRSKALLTGESIGQVSTQTLQNLVLLDRIPDLMIVRPLSTFTKGMIMQYAQDIGVYEQSYKGVEYCALAGQNVVTSVGRDEFWQKVEKIDESVLQDAVENRKIYELRDDNKLIQVRTTSRSGIGVPESGEIRNNLPDQDITLENADAVIDLRTPGTFSKVRFPDAHDFTFQQAWQEYLHWDKDQTYFLLCESGSQSKILAHHMKQEGFQVQHLEGGLQRYQKETAISNKVE